MIESYASGIAVILRTLRVCQTLVIREALAVLWQTRANGQIE
jgi:hypothetical protein